MLGATDPLHQFQIERWAPFEVLGLDLSFTNASFFMFVTAGVAVLLFMSATTRAALVPGRLQSIAELVYEFVADMIRSVIGEDGMRFFPYVFTLFIFILIANLLGMVPGLFTVTSHIIVTFALALVTILIVIIAGIATNGVKFLKLFAPSGLPIWMYPLIVPIEVISFISRPISLAVRLFANMMAGHTLMKVFGGFVISLGAAGGVFVVGSALALLTTVAITALEFLVAFLQAYVFAMLTCIYLNDALHADAH